MYVLIGSDADRRGELWTLSRKLVRAIYNCVTSADWEWPYRSRGQLTYHKPFMRGPDAERVLCCEINNTDFSTKRLHFTADPDLDDIRVKEPLDYQNSLTAQYVFKHLANVGVLKHPRVRDFRPACTTPDGAPVARSAVWACNSEAAEEWLAVRLILLERDGI